MRIKKKVHVLRVVVNILSALIFVALLTAYFTDNLGVNPISRIQHLSGDIAMISLLLCLSITPLVTLTGYSKLSPLRKAFGLNAFFFAVLHVLIFVGLDYGFNIDQIFIAFKFRPFLWLGLTAFIILLVLAVTSIDRVKKAVKRVWKKIHRFVYLAGILVVVHYALSLKSGFILGGKPLIALVVLIVLLLLRLPPIKNAILHLRKRKLVQTTG